MRKTRRYGLALAAFLFAAFSWIAARAQAPQDFPMWCQGATGLAAVSGQNIVVHFLAARGPADQNIRPGHCSWLDRPLNSREPHSIVYRLSTAAIARINANEINRGGLWTFWVFNAGRFMQARAMAAGAQTHRPQPID